MNTPTAILFSYAFNDSMILRAFRTRFGTIEYFVLHCTIGERGMNKEVVRQHEDPCMAVAGLQGSCVALTALAKAGIA